MREARRTFGPVVLVGLVSAALAAVASTKPWVGAARTADLAASVSANQDDAGKSPLSAALALLLLATWGVLLVSRGRTRRVLAGFGALVALGLLATVVAGFVLLPDDLRDSLVEVGVQRSAVDVNLLGWFWVAVVASVAALPALLAAVRFSPAWPAMGSRYDAPGSQSSPVAPETDQELWKALSEGRDPTDDLKP